MYVLFDSSTSFKVVGNSLCFFKEKKWTFIDKKIN